MRALRKRQRHNKHNAGLPAQRVSHQPATEQPSPPPPPPLHLHPVLSLFFPTLLPLRTYLARTIAASASSSSTPFAARLASVNQNSDPELSLLLDTALVGLTKPFPLDISLGIADATQSSTSSRSPNCEQSEIVDRTLYTLFHRSYSTTRPLSAFYPGKPNNILTHGYKPNSDLFSVKTGFNGGLGVDIVNNYPNTHVNTLKSPLWSRLLEAVGEEVMLDLLLNSSVFVRLNGEGGPPSNYYQLVGPPISDSLNNPAPCNTPQRGSSTVSGAALSVGPSLKRSSLEIEHTPKKQHGNGPKRLCTSKNNPTISKDKDGGTRDLRSLGGIMFVRSRMFYSRPACNAVGNIVFGLRHIHCLNRFPDPSDKEHTLHIVKYLFPRQFNLHNVFTSTVDRKQTVQALQDYTLREQEITALKAKRKGKDIPIPKRLKGKIVNLVAKMQKLHQKCSYHALAKYYCPTSLCDKGVRDKRISIPEISSFGSDDTSILASQAFIPLPSVTPVSSTVAEDSSGISTTPVWQKKERFMDFASSAGEVSAFARAVISTVIPNEFWGSGDHNRRVVMKNVDRFVRLRRYESVSLHDVLQGLKLTDFDWLRPSSTPPSTNLCHSDASKRHQLLSEFIYWLFDSFLIPLLRAHFYVTESGVSRNRVFYFRHDVWRKLSEPSLNTLKLNMLEELKPERTKQILGKRKLGFSQIRLLPKEQGVRPIMNLKRRGTVVKHGKTSLTPSINSIMTPVFNVLSFEKSRNPDKFGSSMFSVGDMYLKLKAFQTKLRANNWQNRKLYFAKVDVQACFDTIPQERLLKLVGKLVREDEYRLKKFAEVRVPAVHHAGAQGKPARRWITKAKPAEDFMMFGEFAEKELVKNKRGTIFVDDVVYKYQERKRLLDLLEEHIQRNVIKIGKKFFRQKAGIPQGSVLSTILCNFFYGDLEKTKLSFITDEDGILLRMIDDFLYITLDRNKAKEFLQVMIDGHPEYGAFVGIDKTLANFETSVNGKKVERLVGTTEFPYCGNLVNTKTLDIRRDRERRDVTTVDDSITVEYSRGAGRSLHRKAVTSFKIQTHAMYFDTDFNTLHTVHRNIYHNFVEAAMKFHRSVNSLTVAGTNKRPSEALLIKIVADLLELAFAMLKSRQKNSGGFRCGVTHAQVKWLGARAFRKVLGKKQTRYRKLLEWLDRAEAEEVNGRRVSAVRDDDSFLSFRY